MSWFKKVCCIFTPSTRGGMIPGLNSIRAIAFLAVFMLHSGCLEVGYLGVQGFFVLSGFLLTPILVHMKQDLPPLQYFKNFYGRRALRIFPLYYLYLLLVAGVSFLVIAFSSDNSFGEFRRFIEQLPWALTYTYNFYHASSLYQGTYFLSHFWSLAIEEQFYLLWPLVVFLTPENHLKRLLLALCIFGPVIRFCISAYVALDSNIFLAHNPQLVIFVLPFSHIDAFAIGGYFALFSSRSSSTRTLLFIALTLAVGISFEYASTGTINLSGMGFGHLMGDSYKHVWGYTVMNCLFAHVILQVRERQFFPEFFDSSVLQYLGKISYGLYVFHFPVLWGVSKLTDNLMLWFSLSLLVTILISAISFQCVESKFLLLKDRYFKRV